MYDREIICIRGRDNMYERERERERERGREGSKDDNYSVTFCPRNPRLGPGFVAN